MDIPIFLYISILSYSMLLEQLITDVNIAVSIEAIQAIGNLARGLRNHFSGGSRFLLAVLLVCLFRFFFIVCVPWVYRHG